MKINLNKTTQYTFKGLCFAFAPMMFTLPAKAQQSYQVTLAEGIFYDRQIGQERPYNTLADQNLLNSQYLCEDPTRRMNFHFTDRTPNGEFLIPIFNYSDGKMEGLANLHYLSRKETVSRFGGLVQGTQFMGGEIRISNPTQETLRVVYATQSPSSLDCGNEFIIPPGHWSVLPQYPNQSIHLMGLAKVQDNSELYSITRNHVQNQSGESSFHIETIDYLIFTVFLFGAGAAIYKSRTRLLNHPSKDSLQNVETDLPLVEEALPSIETEHNVTVQGHPEEEIIHKHDKKEDPSLKRKQESYEAALSIFRRLPIEEQEQILREISKQIGGRKNLEEAIVLFSRAKPNKPDDYMKAIKRLNRKVIVPNNICIANKADIMKFLDSRINHIRQIHKTVRTLYLIKGAYKFIIWKKIPFFLIGHFCHKVNNKSIELQRQLRNISYEDVLSNLSYWKKRIEDIQKDYESALYYVDSIGYPSDKLKRIFRKKFYPD